MPLLSKAVTPIEADIEMLAELQLAPPGAANPLGVPFLQQQQTNWCWAACCEMVFRYYGAPDVSQCNMASAQFGLDCCTNHPVGGACNVGNWPERVYPAYNYRCARVDRAYTLAEIKAEIDAGRPVEVYYAWSGGGAHVALVTGYFANDDLQVHDPWYGTARRAYTFVVNAYNLGSWRITYSDLRSQ
jgi:hypothetical protein